MMDNEQYVYEAYYDEKGREYMINYNEHQEQTIITWVNEALLYQIISNVDEEKLFDIIQ